MDYVVGSVAALISGNVTPNRPKRLKKPLTPIKHQPSPNVTPKSELVDDRSIFLSPTMQKKKAIVKKSPKRIFQNPDLDNTNDEESPKADKVKKHLKDKLDSTPVSTEVLLSPKSPKTLQDVPDTPKTKKKLKMNEQNTITNKNDGIPKKKKKQNLAEDEDLHVNDDTKNDKENIVGDEETNTTLKKKRKKSVFVADEKMDNMDVNDSTNSDTENILINEETHITPNKKRKKSKLATSLEKLDSLETISDSHNTVEGEKQKKKKKSNQQENTPLIEEANISSETNKSPKKKNKKKTSQTSDNIENENVDVNPNAVTNQETDSEHESDDEIESENEDSNKEALNLGPAEDSSDEEEQKPKEAAKEARDETILTEDEIKRTLFVGNVLFSNKCKKEIKKIFSQYGQIDTVRIRTIPVKDARTTPKMAVIKNELHPDRTTVNVYVKFTDEASVEKALAANNTVLNGCHLRVSRSNSTGVAHDPKCSVFVGNIPFALEDETLREKFASCGEIESVRIIRDKKTNAGKGFGYVNFASKDGVELALALTEEDLTIKNRILRVKRCSQVTKKFKDNKPLQRKDMKRNEPFQRRDMERNQPYQRRDMERNQPYQRRDMERNQPYQRKDMERNQPYQRKDMERNQPYQRKDMERKPFGRDGQSKRFNNDDRNEGAYRRVMNKRKNPDSGEGPPNKRQNMNQPFKEKKARKEFVGMTAEKKKKQKFNKGQKKKRALSEILTKK